MPPPAKRTTRSSVAAAPTSAPAAVAKKTPAKKATRASTSTTSTTTTSKLPKPKPKSKKSTTPTPSIRKSARIGSRAGSEAPTIASVDLTEILEESTAGSPEVTHTTLVDTLEDKAVTSTFNTDVTVDSNNTVDDNISLDDDDNTTARTTFDDKFALSIIPAEEQNAIATIESFDEQDGMTLSVPISPEHFLRSPRLVHELTGPNREDILLVMRDEIVRLRHENEQLQLSQQVLDTLESSPYSPVLYRNRPQQQPTVERDLRFHMSVGLPSMALKRKQDEEKARQEEETRARQEQEDAAAAAAQRVKKEREQIQSQLSIEASSHSSPPSAMTPPNKTPAPSAVTPASGWRLPSLFGTISKVFNRGGTTPSQHIYTSTQQQSQSHKAQALSPPRTQTKTIAHTPEQDENNIEVDQQNPQSSPFSPNTTPMLSPSYRPSHRKAKQQQEEEQQQQQQQLQQQQHQEGQQQQQQQTPSRAAAETNGTPVKSVRRRGLYPGSANRGDRTPKRPVERNADKRAQKMQLAAEEAEIAREIEQSRKLRELFAQQKRDEEYAELSKLDQQDTAQHQLGDKRRRCRIDNIESIPHNLPGQSTGTFSFREEFFICDDEDGDDYVELDADEADQLINNRPAKRIRLDNKIENNVFQSATPKKQAAPSPTAETPSTPGINNPQLNAAAIERQKLLASAHKPKKPSGLREVTTGVSPVTTAPTPREISAATPAPNYYNSFNTPGALTDITEMTEPETPIPTAAVVKPAAFKPATVPATPRATSTAPFGAPPTNAFGFPAGIDLWVAYPHIFTQEQVRKELAVPITEEQIEAATREFAIGCETRLAMGQTQPISV